MDENPYIAPQEKLPVAKAVGNARIPLFRRIVLWVVALFVLWAIAAVVVWVVLGLLGT
jgi:hypothetical protein